MKYQHVSHSKSLPPYLAPFLPPYLFSGDLELVTVAMITKDMPNYTECCRQTMILNLHMSKSIHFLFSFIFIHFIYFYLFLFIFIYFFIHFLFYFHRKCQHLPGCRHFTIDTISRACYLKSSRGTTVVMGPDSPLVSGDMI